LWPLSGGSAGKFTSDDAVKVDRTAIADVGVAVRRIRLERMSECLRE
jgi:hypothetical protein